MKKYTILLAGLVSILMFSYCITVKGELQAAFGALVSANFTETSDNRVAGMRIQDWAIGNNYVRRYRSDGNITISPFTVNSQLLVLDSNPTSYSIPNNYLVTQFNLLRPLNNTEVKLTTDVYLYDGAAYVNYRSLRFRLNESGYAIGIYESVGGLPALKQPEFYVNLNNSFNYVEVTMHIWYGVTYSGFTNFECFLTFVRFDYDNSRVSFKEFMNSLNPLGHSWGYKRPQLYAYWTELTGQSQVGLSLDSYRILTKTLAGTYFMDAGFISDIGNLFTVIPEIDPNAGRPYWDMWTWIIENDYVENVLVGTIDTGGWVYEFQHIESVLEQSKYYWDDFVIKPADWGDWSWAFNWLRDGLCAILNGLLIIAQFLLYLLTLAFNYLIMGLIIGLLAPFFWNILFYWIWFGLNWLVYWVWQLLLFIGKYLPVIIQFMATLLSYVMAALIWVLTFGTLDFDTILLTVQNMNTALADFFTDTLYAFFDFLPFIFGYAAYYLVILGFSYSKWIYAKARGFVKRAEQLRAIYESYLQILIVAKNIIIMIKNMLFGWL